MNLKRIILFFLIIILLGIFAYYYPSLTGKTIKDYSRENAIVKKVIDGDTIETDIGIVRLLGINTPEKNKPLYQEAKDFLINEIENKSIELLRDHQDLDRYGRKLRYVFYNNSLLNVEIIQRGLATTFIIENLKYKEKFINAEKFARANEIGLWEKSENKCADCIILINLNPIEDFFTIRNNCPFKCELNSWVVKDNANHFVYLSSLDPKEERTFHKKDIWNNDHDRFFMRDEKGDLVIFYEY